VVQHIGNGLLLSLHTIWRLSAKLEPVVLTVPGLARFFCYCCETVSHSLIAVGTEIVTAVIIVVVLSVGVDSCAV